MNLDFPAIAPSIPFILQGIPVTLKIVGLSALIGFILAVILALLKISRIKPLMWIADAYTSVFRGTPLILQLLIIYYGAPQILGFEIDPYPAAVATFALNSGAYISEVIRAGIMAIDKGQREAAMALGVPYSKMMKDIIFPQAIKNILPALMNEFITLTKESAIVTIIGVQDIMRSSYIVGGQTYRYFEPILIAGLIYYVMVIILTLLGKLVERRMARSD
ncbi:amino acid ABC transporter permease [Metabacillus idriensis]|jgi:polar amino acid transport system permease protein|uniref:ABC transporter permease subunit n=1 Tax=Metabacillus idriensis TaxID=324768 RepID=A0A6I2MGM6_9BACI|nr:MULTISPECIES: amino acid ABC transporter permease [Bacillaceae]OHR67362.1 arginine ABC transporter permease [Bacillus sp. HMSC76G11]MCM3597116.1 amino acid ABC transporter permease [Metabacillus idriensis]MDR0138453.1 amino acid ABC transporter permease [Metabacillus idriensis]MRX55601.1 ABC transporter permease subunit [Metabacillus idriensis]TDL82380.1 amino acid ABC transporter permease [Peribacillus frigoritolerans]